MLTALLRRIARLICAYPATISAKLATRIAGACAPHATVVSLPSPSCTATPASMSAFSASMGTERTQVAKHVWTRAKLAQIVPISASAARCRPLVSPSQSSTLRMSASPSAHSAGSPMKTHDQTSASDALTIVRRVSEIKTSARRVMRA